MTALVMPIGSMYDIYIYANIGGIMMVNVTIYGIHGSYGMDNKGVPNHFMTFWIIKKA